MNGVWQILHNIDNIKYDAFACPKYFLFSINHEFKVKYEPYNHRKMTNLLQMFKGP